MAYASEQLYVTWGGTIGTAATGEVWQCGVHYAPITPSGVVGNPTQAQADALWNQLSGYHAATQAGIANAAKMTFVKVAHLDIQGEYTTDPVISDHSAEPVSGGVGVGTSIPQGTVAVTMHSGTTFGKANYGRFYLPWASFSVSDSGHIGSGQVGNLLTLTTNVFEACYTAVNTNSASGGTLALTNMSQVGAGTNKRPTQWRIGDVVDTQRRRRNRIAENYQTGALLG